MAADDVDLAPSPYPSPDTKDTLKLVQITALIVVGVLTMFLLHVLGSLRRRSSHKLLHAVVLGAYTLSYSLVSYILGLMDHSRYYFKEFPVWAVCLLMLLGGTDNLMACNLNDVDNWKSFHVKHLFQGGWVVYIIVVFGGEVPEYQKPLWAMLLVNVLQLCVRIKSMRMASKSNLLANNVKPIVDYMKGEDKQQLASAATMKGYRYVVAGEHRMRNYAKQPMDVSSDKEVEGMKITTVEQIWECDGSLLCSEWGMRLKDICVSMALSKMLNRRFAGFKLAEVNLPKTNDFVFQGLLAGNNKYERAFRVIEVELGFVYDLYYTRYPFLYQKVRHFALCLPIAMVTLCSWLTYVLFKKHKQDRDNIPLDTTLFLMAVVTFLEAFQLYLHMASDWFKVALIRSYVTRSALQKSGCFSHIIIGLALRLKTLRPWENKLGQYSLLKDFNGTRHISNCIHCVTLCLVDKAKKGRKRGKLVKLSRQVKNSIIDSLVISQGHLTNGARSLQSNGVHEMLSWACEASDEMVTHTILVWHVATTICKHKLEAALAKDYKKAAGALSVQESSAIDTASSLSQYCAYLIAFVPDLLPGHSFESASKLDKSIEEACNLPSLRGAKTMDSKCEILLSISDTKRNELVVVGARLAKQLMEDIEDRALRWKVLSDFWAEMMLYVAPCDDAQARAHLEALARGGEFITHLWALLTHAGVLERPLAAV